jgi:hypothetical protein
MKRKNVLWGVAVVVVVLGTGYFLIVRPNAEAKRVCISRITYNPANEGAGAFSHSEYYELRLGGFSNGGNGSKKFKTYDEAMNACVEVITRHD